MMTVTECLVHATQMDNRAAECSSESSRASFLRLSACWRRVAEMAEFQECFLIDQDELLTV